MQKTLKSPSEWIKLLCPQWASEHHNCVNLMDEKFVKYKGYMRGFLSSQALCRISIPEIGNNDKEEHSFEFWRQLGVHDEIDLRYIISQIERFLIVFSIRISQESYKTSEEILHKTKIHSSSSEIQQQRNEETTKADKRLHKRKRQRERQNAIQEQKEAALKRAAELVQSDRVPLQLVTGSIQSEKTEKETSAIHEQMQKECGNKISKHKSSIIISTARDLERIVTHANNLYMKYKAIARQHNQRVSWATVSKELGLHTKVREKYTRMFNRALERGFNFNTCGHYKIKDHPDIFLYPIIKSAPKNQQTICDQSAQQKHSNASSGNKVSSTHDPTVTVDTKNDISDRIIDDQVAAAVDAAMQISVTSNDDETLSEALDLQDICM